LRERKQANKHFSFNFTFSWLDTCYSGIVGALAFVWVRPHVGAVGELALLSRAAEVAVTLPGELSSR